MGLDDIIGLGGKLIDKLIPDPAQKDAAKLKLMELQQTGELAQLNADTQLAQGQLDVDKVEAGSSNAYVASWRPTVGYICCAGLGYALVIQPMCVGLIPVFTGHAVSFPTLDTETLLTLLLGMLGLGGMRSFEKVKGVATHG